MAKLFTLTESAQLLGCAPTSLVSRRWRAHLGLPVVKIGRSVMFDEEDLQRVVERRKQGSSQPVGPGTPTT